MGQRSRLAQFPGQHVYLPRRLIVVARSGENSGPPPTGAPGSPLSPLAVAAFRRCQTRLEAERIDRVRMIMKWERMGAHFARRSFVVLCCARFCLLLTWG
jgi:hypothetical protein